MRLLLDTHVVLWWLSGAELSSDASAAIADPTNEVVVSAATAWEVAIKKALGKLDVPDDFAAQLDTNGFGELGITVEHALAAEELPRHHNDPFDRMLVAQAQIEQLILVTRDPAFAMYELKTVDA